VRKLLGTKAKPEDSFKKRVFIPWLKKILPAESFIDERIYAAKLYAPVKGIPDVLVILEWQAYYFELKVGKSGLSEVQKKMKITLMTAGCVYFIVNEGTFTDAFKRQIIDTLNHNTDGDYWPHFRKVLLESNLLEEL
jgi:hypothetical protein